MKIQEAKTITEYAEYQFDKIFNNLKYEYEFDVWFGKGETLNIDVLITGYKTKDYEFQILGLNITNYRDEINAYCVELEEDYEDDYYEYLQNKEDSLKEMHFDGLEDKWISTSNYFTKRMKEGLKALLHILKKCLKSNYTD